MSKFDKIDALLIVSIVCKFNCLGVGLGGGLPMLTSLEKCPVY